jgi:hypothetical protein
MLLLQGLLTCATLMSRDFAHGAALPTAIISAANRKDKSRLKAGENVLAYSVFGSP